MSLFLSLLLSLSLLASPPEDGPPKAKRGLFALTNARIETVTNGVIEKGTLVIRDDQIVALGADVQVPDGAEVIDCEGLTVYPGLIDSGTQIGLVEIGAVAETRDFDELGDITPHVEAITAVNPNSVAIPVTRVSGVTTAITEPSSGLLPGQAALINLHGYTPEQMHVGDVRMVILEYPNKGKQGWWDRRSDEEVEKAYNKAVEKLNTAWDRAELYARIDSAYQAQPSRTSTPEYVPEMQALAPVVRGEIPLMIKVDRAKDIEEALKWIEERKLENVIFSGVAEGWRVADQIAEAGIPCLVGPVLSVPRRPSDRYDKAYANPGLLKEAGVKVALRSGETENARNLPYNAGFAAAYGLGKEEALRAVTIVPAEIFGVADQTGSLEKGKKATLFVADGDPFETSTDVRHVFIEGYNIPTVSRQTRLYEEFLERNPGLEQKEAETAPTTSAGSN